MSVMSPPVPHKAAMTKTAFNKLLKEAGLSRSAAAAKLGVGRRTIIRWGTGETPISQQLAVYILSVLKPNN